MKAIGIPRISDDIAGISKEDTAKMSLLTKEKIYRGSGPVDLIIGIDHAKCTLARRDNQNIWWPGIHRLDGSYLEQQPPKIKRQIEYFSSATPFLFICQNFCPQNPWE